MLAKKPFFYILCMYVCVYIHTYTKCKKMAFSLTYFVTKTVFDSGSNIYFSYPTQQK